MVLNKMVNYWLKGVIENKKGVFPKQFTASFP